MKQLFKKSLIPLLFGFAFLLLFSSLSSIQVEAAVVSNTAYAKTTTIANSNPLYLSEPGNVTISVRPIAGATSCTITGGGLNIKKNQKFVANAYSQMAIDVFVSSTTTFTVSCDYTETYSWSIGSWGTCTSTGGSCSGSYTSSSGGYCTGGFSDGQDFVAQCAAAQSSAECNANGFCDPWVATSSTVSCTGATTSASCTSQSTSCSWSASGGSQLRTVDCVDSTGTIVNSSLCATAQPAITQSCTFPSTEACYIGVYNNPDPAHPNGGSVTYTGVDDLSHILTNIWDTDFINIFYKTGTTTTNQGVGIISCNLTNGSCGKSNNACTAGTLLDTTDTSTLYKWDCKGINGGTNASCSLAKTVIVNGLCDNTIINSCNAGTLFDTVDSSTNYLWSCLSSSGGTDDSCSKAKKGSLEIIQ